MLDDITRATIKADAFRYRGSTGWRAMLSSYISEPGFRLTYYLRKTRFYSAKKRSIWIIAYAYNRVMYHVYRMRYGLDISPQASIGPGLYIGHFGGVVISPKATLGANVNIAQGVTIGSVSGGPRKGAPVIGDRVWIGANAIIVGRITIGREALIGPGAYVFFDVPDRGVVLGNPGIIVANTGSDDYIHNTLDGQ
jgi:serine O-acetyltransferase